MSSVMFSVVIPTFNRLIGLKRCLDSLQVQSYDYSMYEVIVIDDGSVENVCEIISTNEFSFALKIIRITHGGPSIARNIGIQNAIGDYIIFYEDDIIIDKEYIAKAYGLINNCKCDVVEGKTLIEGRRKTIRRYDVTNVYSFIPCNLIIRRSVLIRIGGYDPQFFDSATGLYFREDTELGFRLLNEGVSIVKTDELIVEHPEQFLTISACIRHAKRYYFDPLLYRKHPKQYRKYIETKHFLGFQFSRPLHLLSTIMVCFSMLVIVGFCIKKPDISIIGLLIIFALANILRYKYQGVKALRFYELHNIGAFILLPFVYWKALLKGCIKFRSYDCII